MKFFSLACTSRPGSPAPAICRRLGLNLSAGSISTHVVLTLPALRSTPRPTCAAQNGLPRSHVLCCAASVSGSTGQQGRCQPPRLLDRAFSLGCAWPSACALPGMCRGYGRDGVECAVLHTFTMCARTSPRGSGFKYRWPVCQPAGGLVAFMFLLVAQPGAASANGPFGQKTATQKQPRTFAPN